MIKFISFITSRYIVAMMSYVLLHDTHWNQSLKKRWIFSWCKSSTLLYFWVFSTYHLHKNIYVSLLHSTITYSSITLTVQPTLHNKNKKERSHTKQIPLSVYDKKILCLKHWPKFHSSLFIFDSIRFGCDSIKKNLLHAPITTLHFSSIGVCVSLSSKFVAQTIFSVEINYSKCNNCWINSQLRQTKLRST